MQIRLACGFAKCISYYWTSFEVFPAKVNGIVRGELVFLNIVTQLPLQSNYLSTFQVMFKVGTKAIYGKIRICMLYACQ